MTFGVIVSSFFFENVSNCWLNSYGKFGGATRRRFFFRICEKSEGDGKPPPPPPPAVRGLIYVGRHCTRHEAGINSTLLRPPSRDAWYVQKLGKLYFLSLTAMSFVTNSDSEPPSSSPYTNTMKTSTRTHIGKQQRGQTKRDQCVQPRRLAEGAAPDGISGSQTARRGVPTRRGCNKNSCGRPWG